VLSRLPRLRKLNLHKSTGVTLPGVTVLL
jgi:hypothetical protein